MWLTTGLALAVVAAVVVRRGLLAAAVLWSAFLLRMPLTADPSAWYFTASPLTDCSVLALEAFGFWASLGGQPLFRKELLADE